jgi:uncharacterized membrane protein YsdA (DUF1294 family)/cold shock CspA family protein
VVFQTKVLPLPRRPQDMRYAGKISRWKDAQGYGFVTPVGGGKEIFVHISSFVNRQRRPIGDEMVSFETVEDDRGRMQTKKVLFAGERMPSPPRYFTKDKNAKVFFVIAAAALVLITIAALLGKLPLLTPLIYLGASVIAILAYAIDKSAAQRNQWRISEYMLNIIALLGGWPGALVAQRLFRHKISKKSFQVVFWIIVVFNCGILTMLLIKPQWWAQTMNAG